MVFRRQQRPRRRRRLKGRVYIWMLLAVIVSYRYIQIPDLDPYAYNRSPQHAWEASPGATSGSSPQVLLKDSNGNIVSRNSPSLSHFLKDQRQPQRTTANTSHIAVSMDEALRGREPIVSILKQAGITDMSTNEILLLPQWSQVEKLYGSKPVIVGLDRCDAFQKAVPVVSQRFVGVSGNFNSGTTAFGISLQANCQFPGRRPQQNRSNDIITDKNGMLDQVPWAKHKMAQFKDNHTIHDGIPKDAVLPVVLVRDPYFWMQSMCKQGYGLRWTHGDRHCPNLVPNEYDRRRFKRKYNNDYNNANSVPVWMGKSPTTGPSWDSLVHYWNAWYESHLHAAYPRLIVRFEDTLFHGSTIMKQVCKCAGATLVSPNKYNYVVDEAKWNHKHSQNNMISAIIKYGTDALRLRNMTADDLQFAREHLNAGLMDLFHYNKDED